ncbi:MAG: DNA mismatch repair protein MutS [Patescibacteria group bacterium]|jgi:DNA mismatch repair protein MutS
MVDTIKLTPGMQQYMDIKNKNPDCIILFRMGDFYETFFDDAKLIARELEITLTSRGKAESAAPLAGIPYHAIEPYIAKLVKKGYKVGMVEQTEDPKKAIGLVKRELVRIITPGTAIDASILEKEKNNYILAIKKSDKTISIAFCDISTGEFLTADLKEEHAMDEIKRINPSEIIYPTSLENSEILKHLQERKFPINEIDERFFELTFAKESLINHFDVLNLEGFGINSNSQISTASGLLSYLKKTQMNSLSHINTIKEYIIDDVMFLDNATIKNLELLQNLNSKTEEATLLSVLDKTTTPMGKRLIKKWIISPLINKKIIESRLTAVHELKEKIIQRQDITEELRNIYDMERLIGRVSYGNANPKDLVALKTSLKHIPKIKSQLDNTNAELLQNIADIPDLNEPAELIERSIKNEPAIIIREGNIIRTGYNLELDELRNLTIDAKTYLAELEEKEKENSGIKTLKIRYNKVIGYFIEITKSNLHLVPEHFIRKQSQVNSERFITEELKELESKILSAQERIFELEQELFFEIINKITEFTIPIQETAKKLAVLDCIVSFATIAQERNYTKPYLNENSTFDVVDARHPVIEAFSDIDFITNDYKAENSNRTMLITGPNMAGKSTYLRQTALISLMAQMGSFVPAQYANISIVDRVFSRIGAYDDLVHHQSTFMVEMNETANILNNATDQSLVILDEIGRGTSTFDGVSLAWAITQHLNNNIKCKTLFATHYHHLNNMSSIFEGIQNYNIAVEENDEKIIFLRKILKGGTNKSYGIQVAKLAGIPQEVLRNAKNIMQKIEQEDNIGSDVITHIEEQKPAEAIITDNLDRITEEKEESYPNPNPHIQENIQEIRYPIENDILCEDIKKTTGEYNQFTTQSPKVEEYIPQTPEKSKIEKLENEMNDIKNLLQKLADK